MQVTFIQLLGIIFIQAVVFGVVLYVLRRLMVGNTESAVTRLNDSYAEINKKKEELASKIQKIEEEYQKRKEEAEKIAVQLKDAAEKEIGEKRDRVLKKARDDAERISAETMSLKDTMRAELRKEEQLKMVDLCEELLSNAFKETMRKGIDLFIIEDFINSLKEIDMSHIPPLVKEVEVVTCRQMDKSLLSKIADTVYSRTSKKVEVKNTVDKSILGGVVLKFGSLVLDSSIAGRLREANIDKKHKIEEGV